MSAGCTGPCDQGRRPCVAPQACQRPEPADLKEPLLSDVAITRLFWLNYAVAMGLVIWYVVSKVWP